MAKSIHAYIGFNTDTKQSEHMVPLTVFNRLERKVKSQDDFIDNYFRDTPIGRALNDKGEALIKLLLENIKLKKQLKRKRNKA